MEESGKITREVAQAEITKWLDHKRVNASKRKAYRESIKVLVNGIEDGCLVLTEDFTFKQTLKFPTEGKIPVTELIFKPRIRVSVVHQEMTGVKPNDADGRLCAIISALTDKAKGIIKSLDTEDYSIGQSIAIFFL